MRDETQKPNRTYRDAPPPMGDESLIPLEPVEATKKQRVTRTCSICLRPLLPGVQQCTSCGFDPAVGVQASTGIGRKRLGQSGLACESCGYDLKGLPSLKCPECGTVAKLKSSRDYDREVAKDVARSSYLTPVLMFAAGASIVFAILAFSAGAPAALSYLAGYLIHVPVGVLVFLAFCAITLGFDAPIHLTALRLTGIYALVDAVAVTVGLIPVGGLLWQIIPFLLYIYMLSEQLDVEVIDAFYIAVVTWAVKIIGGILIASLWF